MPRLVRRSGGSAAQVGAERHEDTCERSGAMCRATKSLTQIRWRSASRARSAQRPFFHAFHPLPSCRRLGGLVGGCRMAVQVGWPYLPGQFRTLLTIISISPPSVGVHHGHWRTRDEASRWPRFRTGRVHQCLCSVRALEASVRGLGALRTVQFQRRVASSSRELLGRTVRRGIPPGRRR